MKARAITFWNEHRELTKVLIAALVLGLGYYLLVLLTPVRIPCIFHKITGLYCPGCGISRFFMELAQLRVVDAARQNPAIAVLLPVWAAVGVVEFVCNPDALKKGAKLPQALQWATLALLIVFGVLRNIPAFSWLRPVG